MRSQQPFAVFDIDGTVIRWQLYHAIVNELGSRGFMPKSSVDEIQDARMTWKKRTHSQSFSHYEHQLVDAYQNTLENIPILVILYDHLKIKDTYYLRYLGHIKKFLRNSPNIMGLMIV